jgi:hypothetical protein
LDLQCKARGRTELYEQFNDLYCSPHTAAPGYNDIGLCDTPPIPSHILRYQSIRTADITQLSLYRHRILSPFHDVMRALDYINAVIKSVRVRWAGHVARMWKTRNLYRGLSGNPDGKTTY